MKYKKRSLQVMFISICFFSFFYAKEIRAETNVRVSVKSDVINGGVTSKIQSNINASGASQIDLHTVNTVDTTETENTTVYKVIETNINGKKKVIESRKPGETRLDIENKSPLTVAPFYQKINRKESMMENFIDAINKKIQSLIRLLLLSTKRYIAWWTREDSNL